MFEKIRGWFRPAQQRRGEIWVRLYEEEKLALKAKGRAVFTMRGNNCRVEMVTVKVPFLQPTKYIDKITLSLMDFPDYEVVCPNSDEFALSWLCKTVTLMGKGDDPILTIS